MAATRCTPLMLCTMLILACSAIGLPASTAAAEPVAELERQFVRAKTLATNGDAAGAERLFRSILNKQPQHEGAYSALVELAKSRALSTDSPAAVAARSRLSERFGVHQTDRIVLFTDVADSLTKRNAQWIERAHDEFDRFVRECNLRPLPLQHKLVCILFEQRDDYLAFAKAQDGLLNVSFTGYYSPRHDRMVFSVQPDRPALENAKVAEKTKSKNEKEVLGFSSRGMNGEPINAEAHGHDCDHNSQYEMMCDSAAKCVHETIHQLMFHTRLMSPDLQYPLWICEGLSTAFETDDPSEPFGPDHNYAPRREAFQSLLANDALLSLRELVTITQLSSSKPNVTRAVYQQSYALVTWMCREKRAQLGEYLQLMREQSPGRLSPSKHLALFERVFGNVDALEQTWLDYERSR